MPDPNELILSVARRLKPLLEDMVFLGGSVVDLLLTDPAAQEPSFTLDVDVIASVPSRLEYNKLGERLKELGFREDANSSVTCRWTDGIYKLDVMPTNDTLGFSNRWYPLVFETAIWILLEDVNIRVARAPEFIATKLLAFKSRGGGNFRYSKDLEDILLVIDGRQELVEEVNDSDLDLQEFLKEEFTRLLQNHDFMEAVEGTIIDNQRADIVFERIRSIASG